MNIIHSLQRFLGLHPRRRATDAEPNYRSTNEVRDAMRRDLYGMLRDRRHDDDVIGQVRAGYRRQLTAPSDAGDTAP